MLMFILGCVFGIVVSLLCMTVEMLSNSMPRKRRNNKNDAEE